MMKLSRKQDDAASKDRKRENALSAKWENWMRRRERQVVPTALRTVGKLYAAVFCPLFPVCFGEDDSIDHLLKRPLFLSPYHLTSLT